MPCFFLFSMAISTKSFLELFPQFLVSNAPHPLGYKMSPKDPSKGRTPTFPPPPPPSPPGQAIIDKPTEPEPVTGCSGP